MISSLVHMSLSSGVLLLAPWLLEEEMVVLDRISEMMSLPLPLPLMSEEFVVLEQISEMMTPLPCPCP
jgi:hypothetical protein